MRATIDVDSFPITVHGQQQGGSYNGYYFQTRLPTFLTANHGSRSCRA